MTPDLEAGAYLPLDYAPSHGLGLAGAKLRLKWVPVKPPEGAAGIFAGLNGELGQIRGAYEQDSRVFELRPILGSRWAQWLLAINPVLEISLSGPDKARAPDFAPSMKLARTVAPGIATGIEYYADLGGIDRLEPWSGQQYTVYWALDIDRTPWLVSLGIGRGLNSATDRWTGKMIIDIPL